MNEIIMAYSQRYKDMEMSPSTILQKHCRNSKKYKSSVILLLVGWVKVAEPIKIIIEKLTIIRQKREQ